MTIFGFNTDVKHEDTVYHVQSEPRQNDLLLQTLVFVKGQCVGKHASSYAHLTADPGFSNEAMHELLKAQHRIVVEGIRAGRSDAITGVSSEIEDLGGGGLAIALVSAERESSGATFLLRILVTDAGRPVPQADVKCWLGYMANSSTLVQAAADATGHAEIRMGAGEDAQRESAVMVQAAFREKSATRKFRFKK
jgi:hypothetical protein